MKMDPCNTGLKYFFFLTAGMLSSPLLFQLETGPHFEAQEVYSLFYKVTAKIEGKK